MQYKLMDADSFCSYTKDFARLYETCFPGQSMSAESVEWRYLHNPNEGLYICSAFDGSDLVGSYSVSPIILNVFGKNVRASQSLHTMTHPKYSGRGIFTDMAKIIYNKLEEDGHELVLLYPNYLSNYTFIRKLESSPVYEIPTLQLDLNGITLDLPFPQKTIRDDEFNLHHSTCSWHGKKNISYNKDAEYLRWRFFENPSFDYQCFVIIDDSGAVRSRAVCKEYQNIYNIVDYYFANEDDARSLIYKAILYAEKSGKKSVTTWCPQGIFEHLVFERFGFRNRYPVTYFAVKMLNSASGDYTDYREWAILPGDDNIF